MKAHLGEPAKKRLILTHHKNLNVGDFVPPTDYGCGRVAELLPGGQWLRAHQDDARVDHGREGRFYERVLTYYEEAGLTYWTMGRLRTRALPGTSTSDRGLSSVCGALAGVALSEGVEEHGIDGVAVHITSPARTVVDCFRYRNKVGLDVALEALRDCYRLRLATRDELWECAGRLRAANVMRPYLESLL